ncbi:hypothetical protein F4780DRAFT_119400 [Xylariomycetidae sp. FL0641]|nr:hypothetical protein F4780DRAFT_119400 [Xylariomycetidae sp. FL0641]
MLVPADCSDPIRSKYTAPHATAKRPRDPPCQYPHFPCPGSPATGLSTLDQSIRRQAQFCSALPPVLAVLVRGSRLRRAIIAVTSSTPKPVRQSLAPLFACRSRRCQSVLLGLLLRRFGYPHPFCSSTDSTTVHHRQHPRGLAARDRHTLLPRQSKENSCSRSAFTPKPATPRTSGVRPFLPSFCFRFARSTKLGSYARYADRQTPRRPRGNITLV